MYSRYTILGIKWYIQLSNVFHHPQIVLIGKIVKRYTFEIHIYFQNKFRVLNLPNVSLCVLQFSEI